MTKKPFGERASEESIEATKKALEANGFKVVIVDSPKDAKTTVLEMVEKGSEVFTATSATLDAAELTEILNSNEYVSVRNKFMALYGQKDKAVEMRRIGSASDYALGSVHAITSQGQVLVASATGSQFPNYAYGASNVIWVVGSQKLVSDMDEAIERLETHTFALEDKRALVAYGKHSSINELFIMRKDATARVTVVIVREAVGF